MMETKVFTGKPVKYSTFAYNSQLGAGTTVDYYDLTTSQVQIGVSKDTFKLDIIREGYTHEYNLTAMKSADYVDNRFELKYVDYTNTGVYESSVTIFRRADMGNPIWEIVIADSISKAKFEIVRVMFTHVEHESFVRALGSLVVAHGKEVRWMPR
jgi:predicted ATP-grasp superfamily ATP-dependent carboligase